MRLCGVNPDVKSYYARNRFKVAKYDMPKFFFGFTSEKKLTPGNDMESYSEESFF
jgi:hypothetical protein